MIKCILLDDELPSLSYLQALCGNFKDVEIVKSFNNPQKFLDQVDKLDFNTCVMDILMPNLNGLDIAKLLPNKAIIFSTAYKEFAADAFDLHAVDYLRKPYQADRLQIAFDKAMKWIIANAVSSEDIIELNSNQGKTRIITSQIAYIEVADHDRRDKYIKMTDGPDILAKNISLDEILMLLPSGKFCRINRRNVIALATVSSYTAQYVICKIKEPSAMIKLTLSAPYRDHFINSLIV
ncbi:MULTISPECIES: LytR/AlgR family response regulator transcription factor [Sphingobacterium]|jgi:DNA-binding LytR/AlgR family response regulator|uniref:LytR/AlgR family response regulator transcription factor n=1 Tax=Sphingobacterium TaxID=28453 RepID=UPI0004E5F72F|nr:MULTISPECIES: response regulator [Sphingobacterium]CDS93310.1 conserved hypothetical protein [Sphingobacterium sp. PM2-P1-29]SJN48571.1 Two-component system response regulator [Sphingobacterium faecium PCAi_F2.5]UPZ36545.1 response regulator [Sphingobacterium sp. PCS056]UXD68062.1 response regulator [Sphingobacterium faecium]WGQ15770.1 response regulator [Sphingobacterium faecium]